MVERKEGIYTSHGGKRLIAFKAVIDGELCMAFIKNGTVVSYEPWADIEKQMVSRPSVKVAAAV